MKRFTEGAELDVAEAHMFWRHVLTDKEKKLLFENPEKFRPSSGIFSDVYRTLPFKEPLNRLSFLDTYFFFADDLMVKNDRMFMAHSLETRFPMMDRKLAEYVSSIPPELRVKNFKRRNIQKEAARGLIPDAIIERRKSGLEIPYSLWVLDRLRPLCNNYFTKQKVEETGILRWNAVEELWKTHSTRKKDLGRAVWCTLIFLIWFEMFVSKRNYKSYLHHRL
jgi:asparagine synthase (glutamine-hydrolysing)